MTMQRRESLKDAIVSILEVTPGLGWTEDDIERTATRYKESRRLNGRRPPPEQVIESVFSLDMPSSVNSEQMSRIHGTMWQDTFEIQIVKILNRKDIDNDEDVQDMRERRIRDALEHTDGEWGFTCQQVIRTTNIDESHLESTLVFSAQWREIRYLEGA